MHKPNVDRGEFEIQVGKKLSIIISPSYGRVSRAVAAAGGKSVQGLLYAMGGEGIGLVEQATFLEQLSKPRVQAIDIGKALTRAGALQCTEIIGHVLKELAKGFEDPEDIDDDEPLLSDDEDDDSGK